MESALCVRASSALKGPLVWSLQLYRSTLFLLRFMGKPSTGSKPSLCASSAISFNQKTSGMCERNLCNFPFLLHLICATFAKNQKV